MDGYACRLPRTDLHTIYPVLRVVRRDGMVKEPQDDRQATQMDRCDVAHSDTTRKPPDAYWTLMWIAHAALDYTCSV